MVTEQYLYYDGLRIAAVLDGTGTLQKTFVYGTKTNAPDIMMTPDGSIYKLISDERGTIRLVVNSSTGAIAEQVSLDEFGNVLSDTAPGTTPFGFAGCLYDQDTQLCHFGAREYDASTGRWISRDPLLFGGGSTNLYSYTMDDPINLTDPSGLSPADYGACIAPYKQQLADKNAAARRRSRMQPMEVLDRVWAVNPARPPNMLRQARHTMPRSWQITLFLPLSGPRAAPPAYSVSTTYLESRHLELINNDQPD